jgi:hypothetical protein
MKYLQVPTWPDQLRILLAARQLPVPLQVLSTTMAALSLAPAV